MEAKTLKENGFEVSAISPRNPNQEKFESIEGIFVWRYLKPPEAKGYLSYLWEYSYSFLNTLFLAFKIYFKRGFSVIHIANPPDFFFVIALFFKLFGVKLVYDQHDLAPEMFLCRFGKEKNHILYKILLLLERMSYGFCDLHITTCESGQEKILSRVKNRNNNFIVRSAPDPLQTEEYPENKESAEKIKGRFRHICSYLGVMGPQDGVDKLLKSIGFIVHDFKRKDIGFAIMGDGDDLERLKKISLDLKISEQVIFTGWADNKTISLYFGISDIGLMPEPKNDYTDNSLHNKVLEYMLAGIPVVSYDLKEEKRSAGEAAIFVENNNEKEFAKSVLYLIDNPERRERMGKIGKERAEKFFNQDLSKKSLLKAYRFLIDKYLHN